MKALVVGAGSIGQRHLQNLHQAAPEMELLVCRSGLKENVLLLDELGTTVFYDLDEALAAGPAIGVVANPNCFHLDTALKLARAGCHFLVEKPLSDKWDGVQELLDEVKQRELMTVAGFNLRFHPNLKLIKSLLDEGRIGRVTSFRTQVGQYLPDWHPDEDYRQGYSARSDLGGGVILDLIHDLDYARWLMGEVSEIACMAGKQTDLEIDTEDVAEILMKFEAGAIGNVHVDYVQRTMSRTCRIIGEQGTLHWDFVANEVQLFTAGSSDWEIFRLDKFDRNTMFLDEIKHLIACAEGREQPVVDVEEGARSLRLALAAHKSSSSRQFCRP